MKHLKRFIVLAMVLGIGGILLMRVPATQFRGQDSQELTRHYNLIKAKDINSRTISLYSDDRKVETSGNDQIWMSDDMTLMIPETMVTVISFTGYPSIFLVYSRHNMVISSN